MKIPSPQFFISLMLIGLFAYAYYNNPQDEMMKGAMIAAFSASYGYWLGSSTGSKQSGDVVRRIAEQPTSTITSTSDNVTINTPVSREAQEHPDDGTARPR